MRAQITSLRSALLLAGALALPIPAPAQTPQPAPQAKPAPQPAPAPPDPIVASVEGHPIHLSDLAEAMKTLPDNLRGMSYDALYPVLL
ncbi:MAG TPA: hypothetical protein VFG12_17760, partial [Rhodopila sp.]|nr:hypothetical protein [Rhodopila sp.]